MDHPVERAAKLLGSETSLAKALGVTRAAVNQWKPTKDYPHRRVPAEHCPAIERLTDGEVKCEELRPDMEWGVLRQIPHNLRKRA